MLKQLTNTVYSTLVPPTSTPNQMAQRLSALRSTDTSTVGQITKEFKSTHIVISEQRQDCFSSIKDLGSDIKNKHENLIIDKDLITHALSPELSEILKNNVDTRINTIGVNIGGRCEDLFTNPEKTQVLQAFVDNKDDPCGTSFEKITRPLIQIGSFYNSIPVQNRQRLVTLINKMLYNSNLSFGQERDIISILTVTSSKEIKDVVDTFNKPKSISQLASIISITQKLLKLGIFINSGIPTVDLNDTSTILGCFLSGDINTLLTHSVDIFGSTNFIITKAYDVLDREIALTDSNKVELTNQDSGVEEGEEDTVESSRIRTEALSFKLAAETSSDIKKACDLIDEGVDLNDKKNLDALDDIRKNSNFMVYLVDRMGKVAAYGSLLSVVGTIGFLGCKTGLFGGVYNTITGYRPVSILELPTTTTHPTNYVSSNAGIKLGDYRILNDKQ